MKTDLKTSQSEFRIKSGAKLEVARLRKAVVDAGFTPTWIRFEARGRVVKRDATYWLQVKGTDQVIPLLSDEKLQELKTAAGEDGKPIFVVGLIPEGKEAAQIERFEIP